jgi:hypothetical protein
VGRVNDANDANDDKGELFRKAAIRSVDVNNGDGGAGALAGAIVAPAAIIADPNVVDDDDDDEDGACKVGRIAGGGNIGRAASVAAA